MNVSSSGIAFLRKREGCVLSVYKDQGGVLTAGVGHTGPDVVEGMTVTQEMADEWLARDIAWAEDAVNQWVHVPLSQAQFDALVSLIFNIGRGAFEGSTLLRKLNLGDYTGAAEEFLRWHHVAGQDNPGLLHRRELEREMFLSESAQPEENFQKPEENFPFTQEKPVAPILSVLLPTIVQAIPALTRVFGTGENAERNAKAAEVVAQVVTQATNSVNVLEAAEKLKSDPAAQAAAAAAVEQNWFSIVGEAGGGGLQAARAADAAATQAPNGFWKSPSFWIAVALIPMIYMILVSLLFPDIGGTWTAETRAAIIGGVVGTVLGSVSQFYFGSVTTRNRPA